MASRVAAPLASKQLWEIVFVSWRFDPAWLQSSLKEAAAESNATGSVSHLPVPGRCVGARSVRSETFATAGLSRKAASLTNSPCQAVSPPRLRSCAPPRKPSCSGITALATSGAARTSASTRSARDACMAPTVPIATLVATRRLPRPEGSWTITRTHTRANISKKIFKDQCTW